MAEGVVDGQEALAYTLATWVYVLHAANIHVVDTSIREAVELVDASATPEEGEAQAQELVRRLNMLAVTDDPRTVRRVVAKLFGEERVVDTMGAGTREERTQRLRSYRFHTSIPWLAQVWTRSKSGKARASWLLIDRVTDKVVAMDPNPWDDVEESRTLPIVEFHVLWELTGCTSLAIA